MDPADLALDEYRNSKDYPDDVNLGIWGRINRAFQDGWARGIVWATLPAAKTNVELEKEVARLKEDAKTQVKSLNDEFRHMETMYHAQLQTFWNEQSKHRELTTKYEQLHKIATSVWYRYEHSDVGTVIDLDDLATFLYGPKKQR